MRYRVRVVVGLSQPLVVNSHTLRDEVRMVTMNWIKWQDGRDYIKSSVYNMIRYTNREQLVEKHNR